MANLSSLLTLTGGVAMILNLLPLVVIAVILLITAFAGKTEGTKG